MKLKYTRAMVTAALNGDFDHVEYRHHEVFNVDVPQSCPNVPDEIMNPRDTWADKEAYDVQANKLAKLFQDNCRKVSQYAGEHCQCRPQGEVKQQCKIRSIFMLRIFLKTCYNLRFNHIPMYPP